MVTDFLDRPAGTEYFTTCLCLTLKRMGIDVRLFSCSDINMKTWGRWLEKSDVCMYTAGYPNSDGTAVPDNLNKSLSDSISSWTPDIVHAHPLGPTVFEMLWEPSILEIPVVATESNEASARCDWYDGRVFRHVNMLDGVIATCTRVKFGVRDYFRYGGPIFEIPYPIMAPGHPVQFYWNTCEDNSQPWGFDLASIGPPSNRKGFPFLLSAVRELATRYPRIHLTVYGGSDFEEAHRLIKNLELEQYVTLAGEYKPIVGIEAVAAKHNMFLLASLFEGLPISIIEIAARGKPVIVTDVGGLKQFLSPCQSHTVVRPGSPWEIAQAVERMISGFPDFVEGLLDFAELVRSEYADVAIVSRILDAYSEVISASRTRGRTRRFDRVTR